MMISIPKMLTWNDRFALIDRFKPTDNTIVVLFGVTTNELNVARNLRQVGVMIPAKNLDYESYAPAFSFNAERQKHIMNQQTEPAVAITMESAPPPETATKKKLKRGRKGNNIATAFDKVPPEPVDAIVFAAEHKVSMAVLRQSKRFDPYSEKGLVRVKKNKELNKLMIWRESTNGTQL